ncbi:multicopper oxidase domain-containing protein [Salinimicrobium sp. TH3]|uniref:multicopper oxidase domain-containing protein n=1 Tax=Salinimicrobium sp. TH3 TaxID=2997342 RepID=UPI002273E068|nr:multicopper oxidase domain-containing protein [Salinimicrobium sp. TH3]MCY2687175.1 multicopper oxidase domain-containing protein [Salinimicrobium sp. TH3]
MEKNFSYGTKLFILLSLLFSGQLMAQVPLLDPLLHPKFENPLPFPSVLQPTNKGKIDYEVFIEQTVQDLGIVNSQGKPFGKKTKVWGYGLKDEATYPGPTIEARSGIPIKIKWTNDLPEKHLLTIDRNIHWAGTDMGGVLPDWGKGKDFNGIPTVTHLHGGHTDADSDGHPEAWYTPHFRYTGSNFFNNKGVFTYDNSQEAATLWYHDHTIGITRLNVYAGLAGFYLLRDDHEDALNLPKGEFEVPLAIQDRSFTADGQLFYPSQTFTGFDPDTNEPITFENSILPEMFGDFILVNGKVWPFLNVQPRKYRLRLLNGSDSRFYDLSLPVVFTQIGSDGGLLDAPVVRDKILIGPGERVDVIVDFSAPELWGETLIMKNTARSPYPYGVTVNPQTSGQIMAFKVVTPLTDNDMSEIPENLRKTSSTVDKNSSNTRELVLFENTDEYGRLMPSLGTVDQGALTYMDELTENPELGATEIWEIYNTTPDAHPIHLHLVHFQVIETQEFDVDNSVFGAGSSSSVTLLGSPSPPAPENAGRKDTFIILPGEVARVKAFFDKPGEYVWHCHILSHEDHDMMRPFYVGDYTAPAMASIQTISLSPEILEFLKITPNPVRQLSKIQFRVNADAQVLVEVYDFSGKVVSTLHNGLAGANVDHEVEFDRSGLPSGAYICKLSTADGRSFEKIIMAK